MIKYTIMVPVYNKIECLKKYFSTIINQNFSDYEIIVVDDCSFDGSYVHLYGNPALYRSDRHQRGDRQDHGLRLLPSELRQMRFEAWLCGRF